MSYRCLLDMVWNFESGLMIISLLWLFFLWDGSQWLSNAITASAGCIPWAVTKCRACRSYLPPCRCIICHRSKTALLWTVRVTTQAWLLLPLCCLLSCLQNLFSFCRDFRWKYRLLVGQISLTSAFDFLLCEGSEIPFFMYLIGAK